MKNTLSAKMDLLRAAVRKTGGLVVAFSGGLDSSLLAAVARQELGDRALAVTALSPTYPAREQDGAAQVAKAIGIRHMTVRSDELKIPGFSHNPPDRCFHCKSELFGKLRRIARQHGLRHVADGTNADDVSDYRPGRRAALAMGVISPLLDAGLGKKDIRALSRRLKLPTADKPSYACLASRFPYGTEITRKKLNAIDAVEEGLIKLGFKQVRVRHHGDIARIELEAADISRAASPAVRARIVRLARKTGFKYVALDLDGYRTGSMNLGLGKDVAKAK